MSGTDAKVIEKNFTRSLTEGQLRWSDVTFLKLVELLVAKTVCNAPREGLFPFAQQAGAYPVAHGAWQGFSCGLVLGGNLVFIVLHQSSLLLSLAESFPLTIMAQWVK